MNAHAAAPPIDAIDRRIILATQAGLPLVPRPYHAVAELLGAAVRAHEVLYSTRILKKTGLRLIA